MAGRLLVALSLLGVVSSFAPVTHSTHRQASVLAAEMSPSVPFLKKPTYESGLVGDVGFDPLGLAENFDLKFLREAELKHGRVAMLAIVGFIFPELFFHLPGEAYSALNPIVAASQVGSQPWGQIIFFAGVIEWGMNKGKITYMDMFDDPARVPGDFGFDPLKLMKEGDPDEYALKEITHCRLAMIAIGGMIHQSFVTGTALFGSV